MAFSPLALTTTLTVAELRPLMADPILAAIDRHDEARAVLRAAPAGEASEHAETEAAVALVDLLWTPYATAWGAETLLRHLRRHIAEERVAARPLDLSGRLILLRVSDLSLLLGLPDPVASLPFAMPGERTTAWQVLDRIGEAAAAVALVVGGIVLTGYASLL